MRIFVKMNLGTNDFPKSPLTEGYHEVSKELGEELIERKFAVLASEQEVKAEAKTPEIKADKK